MKPTEPKAWSFDSIGINDKAAEYCPRIATLSRDYMTNGTGELIAAAPDLLRVLSWMTELMEDQIMSDDDDSCRTQRDAIEQATAAIKKARGESQ